MLISVTYFCSYYQHNRLITVKTEVIDGFPHVFNITFCLFLFNVRNFLRCDGN
jgi:hypothetical protein